MRPLGSTSLRTSKSEPSRRITLSLPLWAQPESKAQRTATTAQDLKSEPPLLTVPLHGPFHAFVDLYLLHETKTRASASIGINIVIWPHLLVLIQGEQTCGQSLSWRPQKYRLRRHSTARGMGNGSIRSRPRARCTAFKCGSSCSSRHPRRNRFLGCLAPASAPAMVVPQGHQHK